MLATVEIVRRQLSVASSLNQLILIVLAAISFNHRIPSAADMHLNERMSSPLLDIFCSYPELLVGVDIALFSVEVSGHPFLNLTCPR